MKKRMATLVAYSLAASLIFLYNDWVLEYILNPHLSANRSLISELSALNQPYHVLFQILDILAGLVTVACAVSMWHFTDSISTKLRWVLLVFFLFVGIDSIIDALLPISCAPSINAHCSLFGTHSTITRAHLIESNIAGTLIAMAPLVWWWLHQSGKHRRILIASIWLIIIETAVGICAAIIRITNHGYYGGIQRVYQLALGAWIGLLAYTAITLHFEKRRMKSTKQERTAASLPSDKTPD